MYTTRANPASRCHDVLLNGELFTSYQWDDGEGEREALRLADALNADLASKGAVVDPVRHTATYGPGYNELLAELIGSPIWDPYRRRSQNLREIDQCVHTGGGTMREFHTYLNADNGKVIKVLVYGIAYDAVLEFPNRASYDAYVQAIRLAEIDPETGRSFASYNR